MIKNPLAGLTDPAMLSEKGILDDIFIDSKYPKKPNPFILAAIMAVFAIIIFKK